MSHDDNRTHGQVRQKLKQVMFRHLQAALKDNFRESPEGCFHNYSTSISGSMERILVCRYDVHQKDNPQSPRGRVCDSRVAGCASQAKACKFFTCMKTKDEVKAEFRSLMASDRGVIASKYPDIAALMWVLDGVDFTDDVRSIEEEIDLGGNDVK